jgi:uncharacterized protein YdcH (DUF465 family)
MAAPVWVLSVDLQAKTATFTSGLAEAAKSARGSFREIDAATKDSAEGFTKSGTNVRAAIGLIDNTIRGAHAMAMADLVREFQHSAIVMAALPFAAVIGGTAAIAMIAIEAGKKIKEWREEQEKLSLEQTRFGTVVQETYNGLDEKIISAEKKTDELRNDHIGALGKELELINRQSFSELIHSLETISKAADTVFGDLKGNWYSWGIGAAGAQHALEGFKTQYDSLLAQGKDKEGSDLLAGTLTNAKAILAAQQQARANSGVITNNPTDSQRVQNSFQEAYVKLKAAGVSYTQKEITAQQTLISALEAQATSAQKVATLKGLETGNSKRSTAGDMSREHATAAKEAADSALRLGELTLAADKATADARLQTQHASIQQRLTADVEFSNRELALQLSGNQAQIAALDKLSKDYPNALKALHDKTLEIQGQHDTKVAQLTGQAATQQAALDLRNLQESEREKIAATDQGSAERLAAIDAAIKEQAAHNLQAEDNYRALLTQRVETVRQKALEEAQQKAEAGRLAAENDMKMSQLMLAAQQEQQALADSSRRMTVEQRIREELKAANDLYSIQIKAFSQQIAALDKNGKDYENKLHQLQDRQKQAEREHENEVTAIKNKAAKARNQNLLDGEKQFQASIARGLASVLMGHQSFASMMNGIGSQIAEGMIQNSLKDIMAMDMTKEHEAAAAARKMFVAGTKFPFPTNLVMAPVLGAAAFASVMAFEGGTDMVPGVGRGDVVPAMLEPGEGVVPGGVMDGLRNMARSGNMGSNGPTYHVHVRPTYNVSAIDGKGMSDALEKHSAVLQKHFERSVRRLNR